MVRKSSPICNYCINKPWQNKGKITRRCRINKMKILKVGDACEYFALVTDFYCNLLHQRHQILHCIQRRLNPKGYAQWIPCKKKCRQFPLEITELILQYIIGDTPISVVNTKDVLKPRKVKRRSKRRIIKRRKGNEKNPHI